MFSQKQTTAWNMKVKPFVNYTGQNKLNPMTIIYIDTLLIYQSQIVYNKRHEMTEI